MIGKVMPKLDVLAPVSPEPSVGGTAREALVQLRATLANSRSISGAHLINWYDQKLYWGF